MKTKSLRSQLRTQASFAIGVALLSLTVYSRPLVAQTNTFPTSGSAGIGTTSPGDKLEIKGGTSSSDIAVNGLLLSDTHTSYTTKGRIGVNLDALFLSQNAYFNGTAWVADNTSRTSASIILATASADSYIRFFTTDTNNNGLGSERMRIDKSGNIGLGTSTPGTFLGGIAGSGRIFQVANGADHAQFVLSAGGSGKLATISMEVGDATATKRVFQTRYDGANNLIKSFFFNEASGAVTQDNVLVLKNDGTVGIGTASPSAPLHVAASSADAPSKIAQFYQPGLSTTNNYGFISVGKANAADQAAAFGFLMNSAGSDSAFMTVAGDDPAANVGLFIRKGGNVGIGISVPAYKLHVVGDGKITGNLTVDGNIAAKYQDVAEWVPSSEQIGAGTVVVLDTAKSNQVISSTTSYDTRVAGVISAQPGIALGEGGANKVLVATTGRVLVNVDASNGPIHIGDLLVTSNITGVAMKSEPIQIGGRSMHMPGTLIGKALEPLEKGSGKILVLLSLQ